MGGVAVVGRYLGGIRQCGWAVAVAGVTCDTSTPSAAVELVLERGSPSQ